MPIPWSVPLFTTDFGKRQFRRGSILLFSHRRQSVGLQPAVGLRHEILPARGDSGCFMAGCLRQVFFLGRSDRRDEAIPLSGDGLYESRALGVILQRLPKLPDCTPDAVVGIEENTFTPRP